MKADYMTGMAAGMADFQKQGAFLSVQGIAKANTMTISWGSIGFIWQKPIFMTMVRQSRYTYELLEKTENFTVSIPYGNGMKQALAVCGSKSGREIDKCAAAGISFASSQAVTAPIIAGCDFYYECRIVYRQPMEKGFLLPEVQKTMYANDDYHTLFYGEIVACYGKEN